jgi:hypothetical protein
MTNDPASIAAFLRTLIVYSVCAILAIVIGVLMTNPMTYSSLGFVAILGAVLVIPILLRWHYPIMLFSVSAPLSMFFIKGSPNLFLVMIALSLAITISESALNQPRFIKVPMVAWPLILLMGVVLITAKLNGGIGLKAFGSDVMGGKKYIFLVVGALAYFAVTSKPIPLEKARLYVALFFMGGILGCIGDFYPWMPGFLHAIYWVIPPTLYDDPTGLARTRWAGTGWAAVAFINVLISLYGMRGIFLSGKIWRPAAFFVAFVLIFFGGFRSALIGTGMVVGLQFFLEGMHRTKAMPFFVISFLAASVALVPLASRLPYTFQRTLAFVPQQVLHLSVDARLEAQGSTDWRVNMWKALLPTIPQHLLLGKGYTITMEDAQSIGQDSAIKSVDAGQQALAISSDYHNGPLSVILPFGIWGVITFGLFLITSNLVIYRNYRYGRPELKMLNTFIFSTYLVSTINFLFLFGGLSNNMATFSAMIGLSIALNGGVSRVPAREMRNIPFSMKLANARRRPQAAFQPRISDSRPI